MKLFEIFQSEKEYWYVPNSNRDEFDDLIHVVPDNIEGFDSLDEFKQKYPSAVRRVLIYTNPNQDYRGGGLGIDYDEFRREVAKTNNHILPAKRDTEPDLAIWIVPETNVAFLHDMLNDPDMVTQLSELDLHKMRKMVMVGSHQQIQKWINGDT